MGLQVMLNIQSQENAVFDIAGLNKDLMTNFSGMGELYAEFNIGDKAYHNNDVYQGPFINDNGTIKMACREEDYFGQYDNYSEVWGCFYEEEADRIAKYMQSGRLVFRLEIEGNETEYYIIEPGKATKKLQSELLI